MIIAQGAQREKGEREKHKRTSSVKNSGADN